VKTFFLDYTKLDHTNPIRKKEKILVKTFIYLFYFLFLENLLHIWKYFVLNIRADSSCPPNCFALLRL